jgi:hypothetical protein
MEAREAALNLIQYEYSTVRKEWLIWLAGRRR